MEANNMKEMRKALEFADTIDPSEEALEDSCMTDGDVAAEYRDFIFTMQEKAKEALAEPPRNCDRFECFDDAIRAFAKEQRITIPWDVEKYVRFSMWLLAKCSEDAGR